MASYGIITGTCSQRESNYNAKLYWKQVSQSIANNTTTIRVWSVIENNGTSYDWNGTLSNWKLTVNGVTRTRSTTNSDSDSGWTWPSGWTDSETGTVITTYRTECIPEPVMYEEFTIPHNSDGTKTVSFSHSYDLPSGGAGPGNVSISGTMVLNTIPRSSVINSFSLPNKLLPDTDIAFSLSLTRYSSSFTHDITLKYGSTSIQTWPAQGLPTSLTISYTNVNTLLSLMSTVTSATLTLTVQTKSGTDNIGSLQSKTAICTIDDSVKPTTPTLSHTEAATFLAPVGAYINTKSKIKFTYGSVSAVGGASLSSYKLIYQGTNIDCSTAGSTYTTSEINWSGTPPTSSPISLVATDSRGRTSTVSLGSLTALAYSFPVISSFTAVRQATATTIRVSRNASTCSLIVEGSQKNLIKQEIYKRKTTESFGSAFYTNTSAQGVISVNTYIDNTSNDIINSYEFKIVITDVTQTTTTQYVTVGASGVETVFALGTKSIGIGKFIELNEPYTLDVGGTIRASGVITAETVTAGALTINNKSLLDLTYPVGAIYISVVSTSPATLFGGTWVAFGQGKMLVGQDPNDTDFTTAQATGGSKDAVVVSHSHKWEPSSVYSIIFRNAGSRQGGLTWNSSGTYHYDYGNERDSDITGVSGAKANMPPYIVVYMWKRTA